MNGSHSGQCFQSSEKLPACTEHSLSVMPVRSSWMTQPLPRGISLSEGVRSSTLAVDAIHLTWIGSHYPFQESRESWWKLWGCMPTAHLPTFAVWVLADFFGEGGYIPRLSPCFWSLAIFSVTQFTDASPWSRPSGSHKTVPTHVDHPDFPSW